MDTTTMDLCRVCLATVADGIQTATLFSTTYLTLNLCDMLSACTALLLEPDDGMPNLICANCLANLITAHEFRQQCYSTDAKLRDILQLPPAIVIETKADVGEVRNPQHQENELLSDEVTTPDAVDALADVDAATQPGGMMIKDEDLFELGVEDDSCEDAANVELEDGEMYEVESIVLQAEEHVEDEDEGDHEVVEEYDDVDDEQLPPLEEKETKLSQPDVEADDDDVADAGGQCDDRDEEDDDADDNIPLQRLKRSPTPMQASTARSRRTPRHAVKPVAPKMVHKRTGTSATSSPAAAADVATVTRTPASINPASYRITGPDSEFPCTVCHLVFTKQFRLNAHMNTHAVSKKYYECDKCKVRFPNEHARNRHRVKHDQTMGEPLLQLDDALWTRYECAQCPSKFNTREALNDHQLEHDEPSVTDAQLAEDTTADATATATETPTAAAGDGDEAAAAAIGLAADLANAKFLCEHCPRVFASRTVLHRHIRSHTGAQQYQCDQCERAFVSDQLLVKHMLRHDMLKKYPCELCDKVFTHAGSLKSHMKTHSDMSAFLCCECGKSFGNSGNLKTHMIRHSGAKPYECAQCFARFPIKGDLYNHMKTHTGARPATCDICGSSFTRQSTLNKHKLIHVGIRPYPCEMCDMR